MFHVKTKTEPVLLLILLLWSFCCNSVFALSSQAREYLRKAKVFFENGSLKDARDYYQRARKIEADAVEIKDFGARLEQAITEELKELRRRARFFLEAKNVPEAERIVRKLLVLAPEDEFGRETLKQITQINEKIEEYQNKGISVDVNTGRAHDIDLYSAISLLNRARGFLENGDRDKALELVEQVLKREPGYKAALDLKERILFINRIQEFVESANEAFKEGRMRECVDSLNKLIKESPSRTEYLLLRAKAYLKLGELKNAEKDLWDYYRLNPKAKDELFALFSEVYYEMKRYDLALGFASDYSRGINYKNLSYQYRCYIKLYPFGFGLMCCFFMGIPFAFYFTHKKLDFLIARFPPGGFKLGMQLAWGIAFSQPEKYLPQLIEVARGLNTAWLNYYAGICLFRAGQYDGAQRFLAFSFSNEFLAGRAYYFYGLTRRMLKQDLSNHDFEESILASLGKTGKGWYPEFVKRIERELITKYSKVKDLESYEGMAYNLVEAQVGEIG
ncbi:MAG: hypothetical protein Kow0029_01330 [Candidatus Rifleibacteriota bacterium]